MSACAVLLGLLVCVSPIDNAEADWQTPQYSVPLGRGTGTGFNFAAPDTSGYPLLSTGASSNPAFGLIGGGGMATALDFTGKTITAGTYTAVPSFTSTVGSGSTSIVGSVVNIAGSNGASSFLSVTSNTLSPSAPLLNVAANGSIGIWNASPNSNFEIDLKGAMLQTNFAYTYTGAETIKFAKNLSWAIDAADTHWWYVNFVGMYNSQNIPGGGGALDSPQAVAQYTQSIKYGTGVTWGHVIEVTDWTEQADPVGPLQGIEMDIGANGADSSNTRSGISINARRKNMSGTDMEVGTGISFVGGLDPGHTTFNYAIFGYSNTTIKNALYFSGPITTNLLAGTDAGTNFYITGAGSIGIGTSSPSRKIHISSASAVDRYIRFTNSLNTTGLDVGVSGSTAGGYIWMYNNNPVYIATNSLVRFVVANDGKVGVGASAPTYQFDVAGTTNTVRLGNMLTGAWPNTTASTFIGHNDLSQSAAGNYALVQTGTGATAVNAATSQQLSMRINNSTYLLVDSTGKVGIGSGTTPAYSLDVNPAASTVRLGNMLAGDWPFSTGTMFLGHNSLSQTVAGNYALTQDASGATVINAASGQYIGFRINNSAAVRIDSAGKVGIGTTSPQFLVEVSAANNGAIGPTLALTNPQAGAAAGTASALDFVMASTAGLTLARVAGIRTNRAVSGDSDIAFSTYSNSALAERWRILDNGFLKATSGSLGRSAPVTKTGDFTWAAGENWIIANKGSSMTVTLPSASTFSGRELMLSSINNAVISNASNVVPLAGGSATTSILSGAGKWATLVSDGTNWIIMQAN